MHLRGPQGFVFRQMLSVSCTLVSLCLCCVLVQCVLCVCASLVGMSDCGYVLWLL